MESNGEKGRIQASKSTADALLADGKSSWLTAREDKIEAKGKGLLQTYWVRVPYHEVKSVSSTVHSVASAESAACEVPSSNEFPSTMALPSANIMNPRGKNDAFDTVVEV